MHKRIIACVMALVVATLPLSSYEMAPGTEIAAAVPAVYLTGPKECQEPPIIGQGVSDGVVVTMIIATIAIAAIAGFVAWGHSGGHHHHAH